MSSLLVDSIAEEARALCDSRFIDFPQERIELCYREMAAAESLGQLLAYFDRTTISWNGDAGEDVEQTYLSYPVAQCRFETLVQSALCERTPQFRVVPWNERELAENSCHENNADEYGKRPRCWFKPRYIVQN